MLHSSMVLQSVNQPSDTVLFSRKATEMDTPLRTVKTNIVQSIRAFRVPDLQESAQALGHHFLYAARHRPGRTGREDAHRQAGGHFAAGAAHEQPVQRRLLAGRSLIQVCGRASPVRACANAT